MSFYDHSDERPPYGQFPVLPGLGAGEGEQIVSGVNQYDDVGSAWRKVEAERARQAERLAAPAPPTRPLTAEELKELNAKFSSANAGFSEKFLGFLKWLVIAPVVLAAGLFAVWIGVRSVDGMLMANSPTGGLVGLAASQILDSHRPPLANSIASGKEIAHAMTAANLMTAMHEPLRTRANEKIPANSQLNRADLKVSAYLCQLNQACRAELIKQGQPYINTATGWGVEYLEERAKAGQPDAAYTACLLPLMPGHDHDSAQIALNTCFNQTRNNPHNILISQLYAQMQSSPAFIAAVFESSNPMQVLNFR